MTHLINTAKTTYFTVKVEECGSDKKALLCVVDEILGRKRKLVLPPHISLKDTLDKF